MKDRIITVRLTAEDHERLKRAAVQSGCKDADVVRAALQGAKVISVETLAAIQMEINKIGVNLNQVARHLNADPSDATAIARARVLLIDLQEYIRGLYGGDQNQQVLPEHVGGNSEG
jgi:hypothetical protein